MNQNIAGQPQYIETPLCVYLSFSFAQKYDATLTSHGSRLPPQLTPLLETACLKSVTVCMCVGT